VVEELRLLGLGDEPGHVEEVGDGADSVVCEALQGQSGGWPLLLRRRRFLVLPVLYCCCFHASAASGPRACLHEASWICLEMGTKWASSIGLISSPPVAAQPINKLLPLPFSAARRLQSTSSHAPLHCQLVAGSPPPPPPKLLWLEMSPKP
jgi:hypothetical protein